MATVCDGWLREKRRGSPVPRRAFLHLSFLPLLHYDALILPGLTCASASHCASQLSSHSFSIANLFVQQSSALPLSLFCQSKTTAERCVLSRPSVLSLDNNASAFTVPDPQASLYRWGSEIPTLTRHSIDSDATDRSVSAGCTIEI
jgi:hypothetical protein